MYPHEIAQLHPLRRAFAIAVATQLEKDRREHQADLVRALAKALAGKR